MKVSVSRPGIFMAFAFAGICTRNDIVILFGEAEAVKFDNAPLDARILLCELVRQKLIGTEMEKDYGLRLQEYVTRNNTIGGPQ